MNSGAGYTNNAGTGQIDKLQRNAYLNSKGINPSSQFQLALLFPDILGAFKQTTVKLHRISRKSAASEVLSRFLISQF